MDGPTQCFPVKRSSSPLPSLAPSPSRTRSLGSSSVQPPCLFSFLLYFNESRSSDSSFMDPSALGSWACVSRPPGWIGAKAFVILSTLICLWKHSPEGLCWRVDDFSYIFALLETEVVLLCVIFSNFIFLKSFIFQQADPGHTSPGGTRCMHIFLIVTMHHRPLLEKWKMKKLNGVRLL